MQVEKRKTTTKLAGWHQEVHKHIKYHRSDATRIAEHCTQWRTLMRAPWCMYTAKLLFHQSLHCTVTTWGLDSDRVVTVLRSSHHVVTVQHSD